MKISEESLNLHCMISKRKGYEAFKRDCKDKPWYTVVDKSIVLDNPFLDNSYLESLKSKNKEVYEREILGIWKDSVERVGDDENV